MVVWHAFDYLPAKPETNLVPTQIDTNYKAESIKINPVNEEFYSKNEDEEVLESKSHYTAEKLEPIDDEDLLSEHRLFQSDEAVNKTYGQEFSNAKEFVAKGDFSRAIEEYKNLISETDENTIKAQCFEEIARIYAIQKRYGSALSAAQRAYNLSPSTTGEVLLARLYYKTGDVEKATKRINNILRREFLANDR